MIIAASSVSYSSVYAGGDKHKNNDNVKVDCNDFGSALATLSLAYGDPDSAGKATLEDELQEGEIAESIDDIRDNMQNVLDTVKNKCEDVDFIGFAGFEAEDFIG